MDNRSEDKGGGGIARPFQIPEMFNVTSWGHGSLEARRELKREIFFDIGELVIGNHLTLQSLAIKVLGKEAGAMEPLSIPLNDFVKWVEVLQVFGKNPSARTRQRKLAPTL